MNGTRVGRALRAIPTRLGMDMTGYIGRLGPSEGTHDELKVRCAAFSVGESVVVLAVCDLLGLSDSVASDIQARAAEAASLPGDAVVVCCTHTHSGPASMHLENCGTPEPRWIEELARVVADAVRAAVRDLAPAELTLSTGRCGMAFNRIVGRGAEEDQRIDDEVSFLRAAPRDPARPLLALLNYACHPVTLAEENRLFSADFPHFTQEALREADMPGLDLLFLPGCCGDLDPVHRGGFEAAEITGKALAQGVLRAGRPVLQGRDLGRAVLTIKTVTVRLPVARRFSDAELALMIREEELAGPTVGTSDVAGRVRKARADYARRILAAASAGALPGEITATVRAIHLGKLTLVTLPFEAFSEIGLAIKKIYGPGRTMVVGYAGGNFGYLPSARLYDRAAYEVGEAFLYYGYPGPLPRTGAEELLRALPR